jgi:hypothetical protein
MTELEKCNPFLGLEVSGSLDLYNQIYSPTA